MTDISYQTLGGLVAVRAALPAIAERTDVKQIDVADERAKQTYVTVLELHKLWAKVYQEHVAPAISGKADNDRVADRLIEAIEAFDNAMMELDNVAREQRSVTRKLEALRFAVLTEPRSWPFEALEHAQLRRRARIRDLALAVKRDLDRMRRKAETPGWFKRFIDGAWKSSGVKFPASERERFEVLARSALNGTSVRFAKTVGMTDEVIEALNTLGLVAWSTQAELDERYRALMKIHHPDSTTGDDDRASKINRARNVLIDHFVGIGTHV